MKSDFISKVHSLFSQDDPYAYLKQFCLFQDLSWQDLKLIHNLTNKREFKRGDFLFEEGYPMEAVFFLESGSIELSSKSSNQNTKLESGAILGMIDAQLKGGRRSTARAIEDCVAYAISVTDLDRLIDHNPGLGIKLLRSTAVYFSRMILQCLSN